MADVAGFRTCLSAPLISMLSRPPSERPIHDLNEILTAHGGASAPGFFTLPDGRQVWEVFVDHDVATLELVLLAEGWTSIPSRVALCTGKSPRFVASGSLSFCVDVRCSL